MLTALIQIILFQVIQVILFPCFINMNYILNGFVKHFPFLFMYYPLHKQFFSIWFLYF